jgi:AraC family transcriptional activator of mtrCDE
MDVLSDVLGLLRLSARVFFHSSFCGSWSVNTSGSGIATFHLIARGACWLHMPQTGQSISLRAGDLIVFPRDARHVISDKPELEGDVERGVVRGGDSSGPSTSLICGYFEFGNLQRNPILDALPDAIHIRAEEAGNATWLNSLMRFLIEETEAATDGSAVVIDRLSDVLFVHVIRTYMKLSDHESGFLAALTDGRIGKALREIHSRPGAAWSVAGLAEKAGMSRSAFARRFQELMNMTPMHYVAHWRMQRAWDELNAGSQSVSALAGKYGYGSEVSFRKAFRKHIGKGPGAVRRESTVRTSPQTAKKMTLRYGQTET